jgi:hypothetical protein
MQGLIKARSATSLMMTMKPNSRMAKGRDLRDAPTLTENLAQTKSGRAGDLKIMNLLILIDSAQIFFRNFGLRHGIAALSAGSGKRP